MCFLSVAGRDALNPDELDLMKKFFDDPDSLRVHSFEIHRELVGRNGRCILCIWESEVVK